MHLSTEATVDALKEFESVVIASGAVAACLFIVTSSVCNNEYIICR